jgi:hypothetical protein
MRRPLRLADQEIPSLLQNSKVHCRIRNGQSLYYIQEVLELCDTEDLYNLPEHPSRPITAVSEKCSSARAYRSLPGFAVTAGT